MNEIPAVGLELNLRQSRFIDENTERHYQRWRVDQCRQVNRTLCAVSIAGWVLVSLAPYILAKGGASIPGADTRLMLCLIYGTAIPILALGFWVSSFWRWGYENLATAITNTYLACIAQWLTLVMMPSVSGSIGFAILFAFVPVVIRMRPIETAVSIIPFMAISAYGSHSILDKTLVTPSDQIWNLALLTCSYIFVVFINISTEKFFRRAYCNERVIEKQQTTLEYSQKLIRRYVPAAVADHITEGKGEHIDVPQRRRVTILFSDIVGFTDMADRLDAESMTQILNEYMAAMADIVEQHGGTLNEFSGDGLMAVFGAPNEMEPENQALNAVQAAQEMQAKLPALNEGWLKLGIGEPLQTRIGINTGVLSVGSFGSEGRMTYTAIGLQTNIAARIQSHCEPGGILLSDASWHLVKDQIDCEPKGEVECKGVHFPIKVYAPAV